MRTSTAAANDLGSTRFSRTQSLAFRGIAGLLAAAERTADGCAATRRATAGTRPRPIAPGVVGAPRPATAIPVASTPTARSAGERRTDDDPLTFTGKLDLSRSKKDAFVLPFLTHVDEADEDGSVREYGGFGLTITDGIAAIEGRAPPLVRSRVESGLAQHVSGGVPRRFE